MAQKLTPREAATAMELGATLPNGSDERVTGYGVIGLPFASGHYLALRDFVASSFGPAYRSVWHRDPSGDWTIYANTSPEQSCARYLGAALATPPVTTPIDVTWLGDAQVRIYIDDVIDWTLQLTATPATRLMTAMSQRMPASAWTNRAVVAAMGRMAGPMLSAGRMRLSGDMPNGQDFLAAPKRIWAIESSSAVIRGEDIGPIGPLARQDRIGGFWLPQRGIFFADGVGRFESFDTARHIGAVGAP
jgi:hypothetical protein